MKLLIVCAAFAALPLMARTEENSCVLVQKLAANLGCVGTVPGGSGDKNFSDDTLTNSFGSDQCAMAKALDDAKTLQKKECQAWLNQQKKELGSRYITGSCKPACSPCADGLQKCTTNGEIRYRLDNRDK